MQFAIGKCAVAQAAKARMRAGKATSSCATIKSECITRLDALLITPPDLDATARNDLPAGRIALFQTERAAQRKVGAVSQTGF